MINATWNTNVGPVEVEVLDANREEGKVLVMVKGQRLSGFWWDTPKSNVVRRDEISDIRVTCQTCGTEICPENVDCWNCGTCWREKVSDEDDAEQTRQDLIAEYQGRG